MRERLNPFGEESGLSLLKDGSPFKEGYSLHFDVICIGGPPGTGKTSAAKTLSEKLGIPFFDIGQEMRVEDELKTGGKAVGFIDRDPEMDRRFDDKTIEIIRQASPTNRVIITARLAPWLALVEKMKAEAKGKFFPRVISIHLRAKTETAIFRIWAREHEEHPGLTIEDVKRQTNERRKKDKAIWHAAHPELKTGLRGDPLSSKATVAGRRLYNCSIATDKVDPEGVVRLILGYLIREKYITKDGSSESNFQLPPQGFIFPAA